MTTHERGRLEGLILGWRTEAADTRNEDMAYARGLEDCADSLQEALTEMGDGWIPVGERLPSEGGLVIIHAERQGVRTSFFVPGVQGQSRFLDCDSYSVTHWQPLPEGPKG